MWFTEDPWPPVCVCAVAAVVLGWWWWVTSQKALLTAALVAVVLAGVIFVVEDVIVTDSERVETTVVDIANAFREKDLNGTLSHFSSNATDERALVTAAIRAVDIEDDLRITDTSVSLLDDGKRATMRFRANATAAYMGHHDRARTRWEFEFERQGDYWKVTRIRRMNLIKDEFLDPLDPSHM